MEHAQTKRFLPRVVAAILGVAALAALLAPAAASAQTTVVVLGIRSLEGDDEFARNLTGALRHAASQVEGWTVSEREVTLAQMALAHGCDEPNPTCMTDIADSLEVDRVLYGEVRRTSAGAEYDFSMNLHLFNGESNEIERSIAETIPRIQQDIDDLRDPVRRFVSALSGAPRRGTLVVTTNVPGAEVFVDDASVGVADADGRLLVSDVAAGTRHVRVVAAGHTSFRSTVSVEAYGEATFEAELQAGAGGGGGVPVGAVVGGALLVVGVVAAALWVWSMTEVNAINNDAYFIERRDDHTPTNVHICDYNQGPPGGLPSDARIADLCNTGRTHEVLQFVFLGTAAVAAGVGAYLLVSGLMGGDESDTAGLRLTPTFGFGLDHGYVGLTGRF